MVFGQRHWKMTPNPSRFSISHLEMKYKQQFLIDLGALKPQRLPAGTVMIPDRSTIPFAPFHLLSFDCNGVLKGGVHVNAGKPARTRPI